MTRRWCSGTACLKKTNHPSGFCASHRDLGNDMVKATEEEPKRKSEMAVDDFNIVTELGLLPRECNWCGKEIPPRKGRGRPANYCKPSHRVRAREYRKKHDLPSKNCERCSGWVWQDVDGLWRDSSGSVICPTGKMTKHK